MRQPQKIHIGVKRLDEFNLLIIGALCPLNITVPLTTSGQKQLSSSFPGVFSYGEDSLLNTCYLCAKEQHCNYDVFLSKLNHKDML